MTSASALYLVHLNINSNFLFNEIKVFHNNDTVEITPKILFYL